MSYSQNDWRKYSELYHGKWEWPNGKNSSEYNAWYYKTHKEKWDKTLDELEGLSDEQRKLILDSLGLTEEQLAELSDEEIQELLRNSTVGNLKALHQTIDQHFLTKKDSETGLPLKSKETSADEDMEKVNPDFENFSADTKNNCVNCSMAYDLRRRGFDVTADQSDKPLDVAMVYDMYDMPTTEGVNTQVSYEGYVKNYGDPGMSKKDFVATQSNSMIDYLETNMPEGSRGLMTVAWSDNSGHAVAWEIEDGDLVVRDCQTGKKYEGDSVYTDFMSHSNGYIQAVRLDDKELNPDNIKRVMR